MLDECHTPSAVQMAVDLANTLRPIKGEDALETMQQLRDFLAGHAAAGLSGSATHRADSTRHLTRTDLAEVRALRARVRRVLEGASADASEAAALINDGLRRSRATLVLHHAGGGWRTEMTSDSDRCAARLAATVLSALASVIATLGPARLGVCAGPTCRATFVDLSRNGSKQYCTRTCAHRASVAAYRSRRSPD